MEDVCICASVCRVIEEGLELVQRPTTFSTLTFGRRRLFAELSVGSPNRAIYRGSLSSGCVRMASQQTITHTHSYKEPVLLPSPCFSSWKLCLVPLHSVTPCSRSILIEDSSSNFPRWYILHYGALLYWTSSFCHGTAPVADAVVFGMICGWWCRRCGQHVLGSFHAMSTCQHLLFTPFPPLSLFLSALLSSARKKKLSLERA